MCGVFCAEDADGVYVSDRWPCEAVTLLRPRCGLGDFETIVAAGGCSGWRPDGQAEVVKNSSDDRLLQDGSDDGQVTTTMGTMRQTVAEHPLE